MLLVLVEFKGLMAYALKLVVRSSKPQPALHNGVVPDCRFYAALQAPASERIDVHPGSWPFSDGIVARGLGLRQNQGF